MIVPSDTWGEVSRAGEINGNPIPEKYSASIPHVKMKIKLAF